MDYSSKKMEQMNIPARKKVLFSAIIPPLFSNYQKTKAHILHFPEPQTLLKKKEDGSR